MLRDLNRTVVLLCPHIDVPWFHQEFYAHDSTVPTIERDAKYNSDVRDALVSVLGGEEFVKDQNVLSEYGHQFDFQCVLDARANPLPIDKSDPKNKTGYTWVAVVILRQHNYCSNKHHPLGSICVKLRELEVLGYKVVPVPYFQLNSMALSDPSAKQQYLRTKIFG